eukprot:Lithocolla_globosa_v1_NODE_7035_length_1002_cov_13.846885.p1 type:complete len:144 gc:universal NODE_7035_length_1002_cov_13.846885:510-79(-)
MGASEEDCKEAFQLFDKEGDGSVPKTDVPDLLRSVGQNPTEIQVKAILDGIKGKGVKYDEFKKIVDRKDGYSAPGTEEEFIQVFQVFDKEQNGMISAGELRYVLTTLGEKLSDRQVDQLITVVEQDKDGAVNYHDFVKAILAG